MGQRTLGVLLCLLLSLLAGMLPIDGYLLSWMRCWALLPFFALGHRYGKAVLRSASRLPPAACLAGLVLPGVLVGLLEVDRFWLPAEPTER